jgi:hypothetical protein
MTLARGLGFTVMAKRKIAGLAAGALGLALSACSLAGPSNHTFLTGAGQPIPAPPAEASPWTGPGQLKTKTKTKTKPGETAPKPAAAPDPVDPGVALAAAVSACKDATRDKGIKSITAIFSHLRPEAVDQDYIDCMKGKGYTVAK